MNFELLIWGDGVAHLAHWDSLHGDDTIIALGGGKAYRCFNDPSGDPQREEIDLVAFLCEKAEANDAAVREEIARMMEG